MTWRVMDWISETHWFLISALENFEFSRELRMFFVLFRVLCGTKCQKSVL